MSSNHDRDDLGERLLRDVFAPLWKYDQTHVEPFRQTLQTAGVKGDHYEELYQAWSRVIRTQANILARLRGEPKPGFADYGEETGRLGNPIPTLEQLESLTDAELVQAIEAAELSLRDCERAVASLNARDGSGAADYWLGEEAPSYLFARFRDWFENALTLLRRLRRQRALVDHRAGTQFQPLDESSPTVSVLLKLPEALRDELDVAAQERGLSRSAAMRAAIRAWVGGNPEAT